MYELFGYFKAGLIVCIAAASIFIFGGFLVKYEYQAYKNTPQAPCYAVVNFVYKGDGNEVWKGYGDMTINLNGGSLYLYYRLQKADQVYTYNRSIGLAFKNLDASRFLFDSSTVSVHEGDTAGDNVPFMRRGLVNGMVTFSRFSGAEYYYNLNNILVGVCHVPN